jgi:hypothetical protein
MFLFVEINCVEYSWLFSFLTFYHISTGVIRYCSQRQVLAMVKLSLCLIKHNARRIYRGVEV